MAILFPIGTLSASSDQGSMDSIFYSMFEPNGSCESNPVDNVLSGRFNDQTIVTRKKADMYLLFTYTYQNIFAREFRQLQHFLYTVGGGLDSFYLVDFSQGQTPTSVTNDSGDWIVAIDNTRLYSTTANRKANRAFLWTGNAWKEGPVTAITTNTSVKVDVDTSNYGALTLAVANTDAYIYPIYTVYAVQNALAGFKPTVFVMEDSLNLTDDGGWMMSGSISFVGKYKV